MSGEALVLLYQWLGPFWYFVVVVLAITTILGVMVWFDNIEPDPSKGEP